MQLSLVVHLFSSWLVLGRNKIYCSCCSAQTTQPINQFYPVEQSRQQGLRAYCPNIYTVLQIYQNDKCLSVGWSCSIYCVLMLHFDNHVLSKDKNKWGIIFMKLPKCTVMKQFDHASKNIDKIVLQSHSKYSVNEKWNKTCGGSTLPCS